MFRIIENEKIQEFKQYLLDEEKSIATIKKYLYDVKEFSQWVAEKELVKSVILTYKSYLVDKYAPSSVNSVIASLNKFFCFCGWFDLRIKSLKIQKQIFASTERELSKAEYDRLLIVAQNRRNKRLYLLMQTICSTGIRVSEVKYITVEAIASYRAEIYSKGKSRTVFLPKQLCKMLQRYAADQKIKRGSVFVTKNGNPLDRSNIWSDMKKLCHMAGVSEKKVFPHNLRHLFARTYYTLQKDIVRLADILGHSSVDTTRIYTMESGNIHRQKIEKLGLLRC